ncbi:restriction endonuclease subunit S [Anabaena sp. CCY 9910]|uniref:restriction endonuclease subunit S n=1 Tax=Anabaena sp. CCY 9910 TaxID=3103870 RepID=UPI0039E184AD
MSDWEIIQINDLVKENQAELQTGPFGTQIKASEYIANGIPVINVRNIGYGSLTDAKLEFLDDKTAERLKVHRLVLDDIVFGRKGAVDRHILITKKSEQWIQGSDCLRLRIKSNKLSTKFLSYYFTTNAHKYWMEAQGSFGATMSSLNQDIVKRINIPIPPLPIQKKIAAILSAYDDLIENNNRRIAILEKMAEEMYREWFVRLRFPGHEQVKFNKGIPEGWEVKQLDGFCQTVTDGTHDTPKPTDDGYFLITGKNLKNGIVDFEGAYKISKQDHFNISKRSGLKPGDIIFSNIGTLGSMVIVTDEVEYSVKNVIIFKAFNNNQSVFLYYMLKEKYILEQLLLYSSGASQQFISLTVARKFKILDPGQSLINLFGKYVLPLHQQKALLVRLNSKLKQTRDRLLTRLISGKLSLEDLDIQFPPSMTEELE